MFFKPIFLFPFNFPRYNLYAYLQTVARGLWWKPTGLPTSTPESHCCPRSPCVHLCLAAQGWLVKATSQCLPALRGGQAHSALARLRHPPPIRQAGWCSGFYCQSLRYNVSKTIVCF